MFILFYYFMVLLLYCKLHKHTALEDWKNRSRGQEGREDSTVWQREIVMKPPEIVFLRD